MQCGCWSMFTILINNETNFKNYNIRGILWPTREHYSFGYTNRQTEQQHTLTVASVLVVGMREKG